MRALREKPSQWRFKIDGLFLYKSFWHTAPNYRQITPEKPHNFTEYRCYVQGKSALGRESLSLANIPLYTIIRHLAKQDPYATLYAPTRHTNSLAGVEKTTKRPNDYFALEQ